MMSTQPPFLAPCLQSSNRSNDDPDLSYLISGTLNVAKNTKNISAELRQSLNCSLVKS